MCLADHADGVHRCPDCELQTAVCNLASVALPMFVSEEGSFDHQRLNEVIKVLTRDECQISILTLPAAQVMTRNLDRVIDITYYPVEEARRSNTRHRPMGLGVQGLADTFIKLRMPFDSPEAAVLNK